MNLLMTSHDVEAHWQTFGNVPVSEDGDLQVPFLHFASGTDREEVWHWFDCQIPGLTVAQLMGVAEKSISQVVRDTTARYIAEEDVETPEQINNGLCEDFANDVCKVISGAMPLGFEEFRVGDDGDPMGDDQFDSTILEEFSITLPQGHTLESIEATRISGHVWIFYNGKHYDSECPEGVDNFFDLPFSRRYLDASSQ